MSKSLDCLPPTPAAVRRLGRAGVAKTALLVVLILSVLLAAFVLSRACSSARNLNVDPQAQKEIEKARHR
jgi:hypothetical protein